VGDNTVPGFLSKGKEEARVRYDKYLICGWECVKKGGEIPIIKSEMFPTVVAEIMDTVHRFRIL
jgi:hypothetical protein